jgi:hypothetical protein
VVIALFLPSFFGDDAVNVMPESDVQGVLAFYQSANPGTIFSVADNAPGALSGRYNLFGVAVPLRSGRPHHRTQALGFKCHCVHARDQEQ